MRLKVVRASKCLDGSEGERYFLGRVNNLGIFPDSFKISDLPRSRAGSKSVPKVEGIIGAGDSHLELRFAVMPLVHWSAGVIHSCGCGA